MTSKLQLMRNSRKVPGFKARSIAVGWYVVEAKLSFKGSVDKRNGEF